MKALLFILLAAVVAKAENLKPSVYYISEIDTDAKCDRDRNIRDPKGNVITKVCANQYKKCLLESTCDIKDGDSSILINYENTVNGIPRFVKVDSSCPYGLGVSKICLDPFFTVAADLDFHKPGTVLFVDKLKGLKLPNGETHNGYVIVRDSGGAINGPNRFDFFTGTYHYTNPENSISKLGFSSTTSSIPYQIVTGSKAEEIRKLRNFPYVPKKAQESTHDAAEGQK